MQLYTLNATPVRVDIDNATNDARCQDYPQFVAALLQKYGVDGFTIYEVQGFWQAVKERSFKIEIASDTKVVIDKIAVELRDMFNQDAVMLTNPDNSVEFI